MLALNNKTKENITKRTGIDFEAIANMDFNDVDNLIEKKIGKKLTFPENVNKKLSNRGSVYLSLFRFLHIEEIDKLLSKI